jgi:predicted nucleic-acid-binding protein
LLTEDDQKQAARAHSVFRVGPVWIAKTVLLETAWVLRSAYKFDESAIREALTAMLGLPQVHAEDESCVAAALALMTHGLDFADALHLSSRPVGAAFVSSDEILVRRSKHAGIRCLGPSELKPE